MQTQSRIFDDLARLVTTAAGAAQGAAQEAETLLRSQFERFVADMDLVPREEFDVVRDLAAAARTENAELQAKIVDLEDRLAKLESRSHPAGE
jgi:hypothetical protein